MRDLQHHPLKTHEAAQILSALSTTIAEGKAQDLKAYSLKKAAEFLAANKDAFEAFCRL